MCTLTKNTVAAQCLLWKNNKAIIVIKFLNIAQDKHFFSNKNLSNTCRSLCATLSVDIIVVVVVNLV